MSASARFEDMTPAELARFERKREQEFYSYYEPMRQLAISDLVWTDLNSPDAVAQHRPSSSPDKALTAFCQLAAIRLGMRRAMIFFFDSSYAYILAEATRTLSLQDDAVYEDEDGLWLGSTRIPRGFSVCEHTVNLPANLGTNNADDDSGIIHIINNLCEDTRFCNRPYVTDGPKARFYAGVPITSPKGLNIGALCVLDDKPHDGLDRKSVGFLQELGSAVMSHIELVRARAEQRRGSSMVSALGTFMGGSSEAWRSNHAGSATKMPSPKPVHLPAESAWGIKKPTQTDSVPDLNKTIEPIARRDSSSQTVFTPVQWDERILVQDERPSSQLQEFHNARESEVNSNHSNVPELDCVASNIASTDASVMGDDPQHNLRSSAVHTTFQSAAELIRLAVDADGVLFLDASISGFGELAKNAPLHDAGGDDIYNGDSSADCTDGTGNGDHTDRGDDAKDAVQDTCPILGASYASSQGDRSIAGDKVSKSTLQSLLRHYKHGKIWNSSLEDDSHGESPPSGSRSASDNKTVHPLLAADQQKGRKHKRRRTKVALSKEIRSIVPGYQSLMLLGLWDPSRDKWYAGCIIWSYAPTRVFSGENEMNYLIAFCDIVMAKLTRLDVDFANKAKSDFISSISHELRSPLHGILGTIELLQDQVLDPSTAGMITQIEVCGRTLLDVVDHLLDFSKINSFAKQTRVVNDPSQKGRRGLGLAGKKRDGIRGMISVDADVSLDHVTEEVVETAVYSYCCSKDQGTLSARHVTAILDIEKSPLTSWKCRIAVGAWKRICINLVSNALKYTAEGFILVSLKVVPTRNRNKRPCAQLTVADSGRGMSKEFLENQLFRAFSQENDLAEGTGLGMNMVAKIVRSLRGKIDVQSAKNAGTAVVVTVPLELSSQLPRTLSDRTQEPSSTPSFDGMTIGFLGHPAVSGQGSIQEGHSLQTKTLQETCNNLNAKLTAPSWNISEPVKMTLTTEDSIPDLTEILLSRSSGRCLEDSNVFESMRSKPLLVICDDYMSALRLKRSRLNHLVGGHVEYIFQPCGPERIASAISICLNSPADGYTTTNGPKMPPTPMVDDYLQKVPNSGLRVIGFSPDSRANSWREDVESNNIASPPRISLPLRVTSGNASVSKITESDPPCTSFWNCGSKIPHRGIADEYPFPQSSIDGAKDLKITPSFTETSRPMPNKRNSDNNIDQSKPCLLLVDDNDINLRLLVTYAKKHGHRKHVAMNGAEAVEAYKTAVSAALAVPASPTAKSRMTPDKENSPKTKEIVGSHNSITDTLPMPTVILMDISMPVMDGFEATRRIRAFEQKHDIKPATIIALTGLGSADAQNEAFVSGVNLFLTKPVRLKELTKLLKEIQESGKTGETEL